LKILLISPTAKKYVDPLTTPLGILSIATYLEQHNHTVMIYESAVSKGNFENVLGKFAPDIVGVSIISGKALDDAMKLSKYAKDIGITVVWGGFLPSVMPELSLKTGCVDIISIGEGEYTMLDLLDAIETGRSIDTVKGLAYIKDGQVITTPQRDFICLSELPVLDFNLIDIKNYLFSYYSCKKAFYLYSSKGCTGHCTFCYNSNFNKSSHRIRPPEHVVEEITYLVDKYGVDGIHFNDDLMFVNKDEMYSLCSLIKEAKLAFYWGCFSIIGLFGKEEFQFMYDSGCRWIFFGIESGSREMLKKIKKGINYDKIEQTYVDCADVGIIARAGFILGLPGETEADLRETISLALRLKTSQISFNYYTLVPNSEAYVKMLNEGKFDRPKSLQDFAADYPFDKLRNFSNIPDKELKVVYSYFVLRRLFVKDSTTVGKSNSWWAITSSFLIKSLRESSIEKFNTSIKLVLSVLFFVFFHPKIRLKYGLKLNFYFNHVIRSNGDTSI